MLVNVAVTVGATVLSTVHINVAAIVVVRVLSGVIVEGHVSAVHSLVECTLVNVVPRNVVNLLDKFDNAAIP